MAGEKKPTTTGDDGLVDVEGLFEDLFEEAPPTDPMVPTVPALDEEVTLEVPAAAAAAGVRPKAVVDATVDSDAESEPESETPALFAPILPEMEAEIWQAGIQALVTVPDRADPPATSHDDWLAEARLFQAESGSADTPVLAAALLTAAARAAEIAGEAAEAASGYDEALARAPTAPDALRARARLAESVGDLDEAHALWARLAISAGTAEERAFYGALSAEWTLARRGALPAVAMDAIPAGPARALAVAEEALRGGTPASAAAAFAAAGRVLGGGFGAAFLEQAARYALVARDAASAAAYRTAARKIDPHLNPTAPESLLGRLREAARMDPGGGGAKVGKAGETADLDQTLAALPEGLALAQAVGRWAAARARRRGDTAGALALLTGLGATTAAAARDRIDVEVVVGSALDPKSLARLRESVTAPAAAANLILDGGWRSPFVGGSMKRRPRCSRRPSMSTPTPFRSRCWPRRLRRPPTMRRWRPPPWTSGCAVIRLAAPRPRWRWRRPVRRPAPGSTRAPLCRPPSSRPPSRRPSGSRPPPTRGPVGAATPRPPWDLGRRSGRRAASFPGCEPRRR